MAEWYQICCTELFRSPFLITAKCSHTSEWRCQWRYLPLYRGWKIRITATKRIKVNNLGRAVWNLITQKTAYSFEYAVFCVGIYLFSRAASRRVSSAQASLTSVFGMGTGGPSPQSTPTIYAVFDSLIIISLLFTFVKYFFKFKRAKKWVFTTQIRYEHSIWCGTTKKIFSFFVWI